MEQFWKHNWKKYDYVSVKYAQWVKGYKDFISGNCYLGYGDLLLLNYKTMCPYVF